MQLTLITFKKARFQYSNYDIFLKLVLCIFWTFTASIHLHKNEAWIRAYIFCNITFVKSNTSNTLLKIAVPWVNTESLNVTKPIWLQFYITCNQSKVILKISTVPGLVIIEMAWNNRNLIVINAITFVKKLNWAHEEITLLDITLKEIGPGDLRLEEVVPLLGQAQTVLLVVAT